MATSLEVPVLWRDAAGPCIKGTAVVAVEKLPQCGREGAKVKDLIELLNDKFQQTATSTRASDVRRVNSLLLYGTRLSHERLLSSVIIELSACCPRLVATTRVIRRRVKIANIFVLPPNGHPLCLVCALDEPIDEVKHKIQDRTSIPVAEQLLTFAGRPLNGSRTLEDYAAYSDCTLHLVVRLRGGFTTGISAHRFADVSDESLLEMVPFNHHAPAWRKVGKGLNLEGRCGTGLCAAFRQWVIQAHGFEPFNLRTDGPIRCPVCASSVTPLSCWFYDCVWKYEGVRSGGTLLSSPWKNAFGSYHAHHFNANETHGIVTWESLVIAVKPRDVAQAALGAEASCTLATSRDQLCSVCWSPSSSGKRFKRVSCGHTVHKACINEWAAWCKRGGTLFNCPVCRKDLSVETESEMPSRG